MKPHQQLEVWKRSFEFVKNVYEVTGAFPSDEKYGLTSQIRRASVSIPANISEGAAKNSKKEFVRFLYIALGSASELDTLILLSHELKMIEPEKFKTMNNNLEIIYKMLLGLINRNKNLYS